MQVPLAGQRNPWPKTRDPASGQSILLGIFHLRLKKPDLGSKRSLCGLHVCLKISPWKIARYVVCSRCPAPSSPLLDHNACETGRRPTATPATRDTRFDQRSKKKDRVRRESMRSLGFGNGPLRLFNPATPPIRSRHGRYLSMMADSQELCGSAPLRSNRFIFPVKSPG